MAEITDLPWDAKIVDLSTGFPTREFQQWWLNRGAGAGADFMYETIDAMAAAGAPENGQIGVVYTWPRAGVFVYDSSDLSTQVTGDPGQGVYVAPDSDTSGNIGAWVRKEALAGYVKAEWFGLDPSLADCSDVLININEYLVATTNTVGSENFNTLRVLFGSGTFVVKESGAFLDGDLGPIISGISYEGVGSKSTYFSYEPAAAGPMINNTRGQNIKIKGMTFEGALSTTGSTRCTWMYSEQSTGYATQRCHFDDLEWLGVWDYGVDLVGENNNSEHTYYHCSWYFCDLTAWQHANENYIFFPLENGSDQFLNYSYLHCTYWGCSGPWLDMQSGGHFYFQDCDVSAWGHETWDWTTEKFLFNVGTILHNLGSCSLIVDGLRIELYDANAKILYENWPFGQINFRSCDTSALSWRETGTETATFFHLIYSSANGPTVQFTNCDLMGKAYIEVDVGTGEFTPAIDYDGCTFFNVDRFSDYFTFDYPTTPISYIGHLPLITGRNCRARQVIGNETREYRQIMDFVINEKTIGNYKSQRITEFRSVEDYMPTSGYNGTHQVMFPVGAHIRRLHIWAPAGHTTEAAAITFDLYDQANNLIASVTSSGLSNAGFDDSVDIDYTVVSGGDILRIETDQTHFSSTGHCELEWVG